MTERHIHGPKKEEGRLRGLQFVSILWLIV